MKRKWRFHSETLIFYGCECSKVAASSCSEDIHTLFKIVTQLFNHNDHSKKLKKLVTIITPIIIMMIILVNYYLVVMCCLSVPSLGANEQRS